ncbi:MAG: hypothetical protein M1324_02570 [Patescibacteria group bacterium]|nr:hypothetical protein [Patescibacteria group bacterium]
MRKAFEELVEVLWRYGNAGLIPCSVILLVDGEVPRASTVGVLNIDNADPYAFLDRAEARKTEFQVVAPFSPEVNSAVDSLIAKLKGKQYVLTIMHPSPAIEDILVLHGTRISSVSGEIPHGWGYGTVALSTRNISIGIVYVTPKAHQLKVA